MTNSIAIRQRWFNPGGVDWLENLSAINSVRGCYFYCGGGEENIGYRSGRGNL
jgi:hypothetical protein